MTKDRLYLPIAASHGDQKLLLFDPGDQILMIDFGFDMEIDLNGEQAVLQNLDPLD